MAEYRDATQNTPSIQHTTATAAIMDGGDDLNRLMDFYEDDFRFMAGIVKSANTLKHLLKEGGLMRGEEFLNCLAAQVLCRKGNGCYRTTSSLRTSIRDASSSTAIIPLNKTSWAPSQQESPAPSSAPALQYILFNTLLPPDIQHQASILRHRDTVIMPVRRNSEP